MGADNIWFPLYIGDYLADTMHLTQSEHGAYLLLLFAYYRNRGPLEDDDKNLMNITKSSLSDWSATRSMLAKFFKIAGGKWIHPRADIEIERSKSVQDAKRKGATITNRKRWGLSHSDTLSESHSDTQSQSQSQSHTQKKSTLSGKPDAVPLSSWKSPEIQTKSRIVLHHLNEKAGKHFRETEDNLKIIACRLIEVESDTDGIRRMVDRMCQKWLTDPKMNEYLRPSTLFAKGNFGGYYDQRNDAVMAQFTNGKPHEKTLLDKETDRITRQCKTL